MVRVILALAALIAPHDPTALERLDALVAAVERAAFYASALEHDPVPLADEDRRALATALATVDARFDAVLRTPEAISVEDARDLWNVLRAADRAAREWSSARKAGDVRGARDAARRVREALDRAQAIVSAAEATCA